MFTAWEGRTARSSGACSVCSRQYEVRAAQKLLEWQTCELKSQEADNLTADTAHSCNLRPVKGAPHDLIVTAGESFELLRQRLRQADLLPVAHLFDRQAAMDCTNAVDFRNVGEPACTAWHLAQSSVSPTVSCLHHCKGGLHQYLHDLSISLISAVQGKRQKQRSSSRSCSRRASKDVRVCRDLGS